MFDRFRLNIIESNSIQLSLIRLYRINCFFQFWYGPCSFSKMCFTKNDMFAFVRPTFLFFCIFSIQKRHALKCCEDLPNFQPVNSDSRPFRAFEGFEKSPWDSESNARYYEEPENSQRVVWCLFIGSWCLLKSSCLPLHCICAGTAWDTVRKSICSSYFHNAGVGILIFCILPFVLCLEV